MSKLFDLDSPFMNVINKLSDIIIINLVYIFCCLPVFTIGAATTALYYTVFKIIEDRGSSIIKSFFHSFKQNFKQGTIIWLIILVLGAITGMDFYFINLIDKGNMFIGVIFLIPAVLLLFVMTYVFALLARFDNTVKQTLLNAFFLSVAKFPKTIVAIVINLFPYCLLYASIKSVPLVIFLGFSGTAYFNSLTFLKLFEQFMPKDELEIEMREKADKDTQAE